MVIGVLQFELLIHDSESLKDKRRVVRSVKDRLHREHLVAVAEVGAHDSLDIARLAVAAVGVDGKIIGQTLDRICEKLRSLTDAELGATSREILHGLAEKTASVAPAHDDTLAEEMIRRMAESDLRTGEESIQ